MLHFWVFLIDSSITPHRRGGEKRTDSGLPIHLTMTHSRRLATPCWFDITLHDRRQWLPNKLRGLEWTGLWHPKPPSHLIWDEEQTVGTRLRDCRAWKARKEWTRTTVCHFCVFVFYNFSYCPLLFLHSYQPDLFRDQEWFPIFSLKLSLNQTPPERL